jgi:hypothetical protein
MPPQKISDRPALLAGALRLTQQGRLKEAMDILRGKTASGKLTDPDQSPQPRKLCEAERECQQR